MSTTTIATERAGEVRLATGGDPDKRVLPPRKDEFAADEFVPDDRLEEIVAALRPLVGVPDDPAIVVRWKEKGGESNGKATLGKCVKLSGHARHFAGADYLVWVAADHVRVSAFSARQLEALLWHELEHVLVEYDEKTGDPAYKVVGHDCEMFRSEVERYGLWRFDLEAAADAFAAVRQLPLAAAD